jgi:spoIIIJ-associated protein
MNEKRASLEVIAPSIEEAIQKGLDDLGLPRESVEVEVLDEGTRGLFGLGSRQARIRLKIKEGAEPAERESAEAEPTPKPAEIETEAEPEPAPEPTIEAVSPEEEYVLTVASETVSELLEKMKVHATVTAEYGKADDSRSRVPVLVNVNGNDLSILIGRRAETLNALQYITNLIVNKEIGRSIPLVVDVEGYRKRRETQLQQIADRMADQAVKTGRRQVLEPMPANERRLVHIHLRGNPEVTTESVGDDPRRKVTIIPKQ